MSEKTLNTTKKRILFVDDEQRILDGLRRMLFHMRKDWDMYFSLGGKAALELMEKTNFDVIISDMRMPEMDGAELLNIVREKYPDTVRFILSGYSDKEMIMRTVGATDQFLTKPCNQNVLKETINKVLEAREFIDSSTHDGISNIRSMPVLPELYVELRELLNSPKSSLNDVSEIVSKDVSVAAKVLQLVNSAFFGLKHRVESIHHAVTYLGVETLKALILTTEIFNEFSDEEIKFFHIRELYNHCVLVGALAEKIAKDASAEKQVIDEACMAGILHDIGKIVFIQNLPEEYKEVIVRSEKEKVPSFMLEEEILKDEHSRVGAYLMSLWGLPESIVSSIRFHHCPREEENPVFDTAAAVYIANVLVHQTTEEYKDHIDFNQEYIEKLGVADKIPDWRQICEELCEGMEN